MNAPVPNDQLRASLGAAQERDRLTDRLKLVFASDEVWPYTDFRTVPPLLAVLVMGCTLQRVREQLDKAGVHIYSETPVIDKSGRPDGYVLDLVSYGVMLRLIDVPAEQVSA